MSKRPAISLIGEDACTGCFLCGDVCLKKAIEFRLDETGFYKPYVDANSCNGCGLCAASCPVITSEYSRDLKPKPDVYGGWSNDEQIRLNSSSGGIFYEFAKRVIEDGGVVCGVRWRSGKVEFDMVDDICALRGLMGSKYLQADATGIYAKVKKIVKEGRCVLFVGLPCQVQALSNYVKSELLYTVDLVCAGVPSVLMFNRYCEEYFPGETVTEVKFRVKNLSDSCRTISSWKNYSIEYYSKDKLLLSQEHCKDPYFLAFNSAKCYNTACYECSLNTYPRRGNMSFCDYWGAKGDMDCEKGTSLLLVNDSKGDAFYERYVKNDSNLFFRSIIDDTPIKGTPRLNMKRRSMPKERSLIFESLKERGFAPMYNKYIKPSFMKKVTNVLKNIFEK
jgi:coenzyme F420-reducing hydrogenase beta subunit